MKILFWSIQTDEVSSNWKNLYSGFVDGRLVKGVVDGIEVDGKLVKGAVDGIEVDGCFEGIEKLGRCDGNVNEGSIDGVVDGKENEGLEVGIVEVGTKVGLNDGTGIDGLVDGSVFVGGIEGFSVGLTAHK